MSMSGYLADDSTCSETETPNLISPTVPVAPELRPKPEINGQNRKPEAPCSGNSVKVLHSLLSHGPKDKILPTYPSHVILKSLDDGLSLNELQLHLPRALEHLLEHGRGLTLSFDIQPRGMLLIPGAIRRRLGAITAVLGAPRGHGRQAPRREVDLPAQLRGVCPLKPRLRSTATTNQL